MAIRLINLGIKWRGLLPARSSSFLSWSRTLFFTIGILALGYVGLALLDARLYQADQTRRFEEALKRLRPAADSGEHLRPSRLSLDLAEGDAVRAKSLGVAVSEGAPLGRIEISSIGLAAIMMDGISRFAAFTRYRALAEALAGEPRH